MCMGSKSADVESRCHGRVPLAGRASTSRVELHAGCAFPIPVGTGIRICLLSQDRREPDEKVLTMLAGVGSQIDQLFAVREFVGMVLESQGYTVLEVRNHSEALALRCAL